MLNMQSGKYSLLKVLALTHSAPVLYVTNQVETARQKFREDKDLQLEYHCKEEEDNRIARKIMLQEVDLLCVSFEMFLSSDTKHMSDTLLICDYTNVKLLNQMLVERVNRKYKETYSHLRCVLFTDIMARSMVLDLWETISIHQVLPKVVTMDAIQDSQANRLVSLNNVLHTKYEDSQWKSLLALIKEKQEKSKHPIVMLCSSAKDSQTCQRQLLQGGVKCRVQKTASHERGVVVGIVGKWVL